PEEFATHPKFKRHMLGRWMTFRDAFEYANEHLKERLCCILNLDIFLDSTIDWTPLVEILAAKPIVLCLSRPEFNDDGTRFRNAGLMAAACANSQDAWLFRTPIQVDRCDFEIGTMGCDNAIADRVKRAGYLPLNLPQQFRVFHFDRAR